MQLCAFLRNFSKLNMPNHTDPEETEHFKLKVGRAVNLVKRVDQWEKQCGSREQVLRGYYPGAVEFNDGGTRSLMKGRLSVGEAGPWCHRTGKNFFKMSSRY